MDGDDHTFLEAGNQPAPNKQIQAGSNRSSPSQSLEHQAASGFPLRVFQPGPGKLKIPKKNTTRLKKRTKKNASVDLSCLKNLPFFW